MKTPTGTYSMQDTAKMIGVGPNRLFEKCREQKILDSHNLPYQRYIDADYFQVQMGDWQHNSIGQRLYARVFVTVRGVKWLSEHINKEQAA